MQDSLKPESIDDLYDIEKRLDEGSFGIVYRARDKTSNERVAIKHVKKQFKSWKECKSIKEVRFLMNLKHKNVIHLKNVLLIKKDLFLVYEYAEMNLLQFYLKYKKEVG